ncbi:MAG: IMP cyclohydrolase, partial [Lawsonibacter sp.]|nr:IMP cyclohydrolase [Lawsonibacter sp.]
MKTLDLNQLLANHPYPGRGIMLGRSADHTKAIIAYFIMGRSENSRNRVFEETGDGIRTLAHDESKMTDPSLIIYHPVRILDSGVTVVTNGDQTDTICDFLLAGKSYMDALRTRCFEPDPPNYTPRISGVV